MTNQNIKPIGPIGATKQKFPRIDFQDDHNQPCELEMSTVCHGMPPGESAIWLGTVEAPMHLNREQVESLVGHLIGWLEFGKFEFPPSDAPERDDKTNTP